jgi:septin family protein
MQDLQEVTHEIHYENYRSEKLQPKNDKQQKKLIQEKDDEVN